LQRLVESAEQAAVSAPREGNVLSKYYASHQLNNLVSDDKSATGMQEMFLAMNRHFDHLAVNVTLSAVLLPSGVKDNGEHYNFRNPIK
jgi:hypothetical protein